MLGRKADFKKIEELYNEGLTDTGIAKITNVHQQTVRKWRDRNGLLSNYVKNGMLSDTESALLEELYTEGYTDLMMAQQLNISQRKVCNWRMMNNKLPNYSYMAVRRKKLLSEEESLAIELYDIGFSDFYIAYALCCSTNVISNWRLQNNLPPNSEIQHKRCAALIDDFDIDNTEKPWSDPESLFCNTAFLEREFKVKIKLT
jgi:DNA-binding transcriptional regulator YiaG